MADKKSEKEVPETLIKYYPCNEYSYDALKNNYLWASHPEQFNDPFDCSPKLWDAGSFTKEKVGQIINIKDDPIHQKFLGSRDLLDLVLAKIGVICLNSGNRENDDLFWGYYSNQKGFAIEFSKNRLTEELDTFPQEVTYFTTDIFEKYIFPTSWEKLVEISIKWVKQKKQIWGHEDELRYIFFNCDSIPFKNLGNSETRKKYYSSDTIIKIILGLKFFGDCLELIEGENQAFIYNLTKESNPHHYKLLNHLIANPQYPIYWMFPEEKLQLKPMPLKLSYVDPWNIIIKIENGN